MGTASTMNAMAEALGMALPGSSSIPAVYRERGACAYQTGRRIVDLVKQDVKPSDIMTKEAFDLYVRSTGVNLEEIRDSRYDMVIHMVTAADGAAAHYTLANNKARSEGIEQAIAIDNKIKQVWNGHHNHV